MRRRLTVTGASQNIDGVVKPGVAESGDLKKYKGKKDKVGLCLFQEKRDCICHRLTTLWKELK
jgi:hypothetical protein